MLTCRMAACSAGHLAVQKATKRAGPSVSAMAASSGAQKAAHWGELMADLMAGGTAGCSGARWAVPKDGWRAAWSDAQMADCSVELRVSHWAEKKAFR